MLKAHPQSLLLATGELGKLACRDGSDEKDQEIKCILRSSDHQAEAGRHRKKKS